jgi:hypothetical protein
MTLHDAAAMLGAEPCAEMITEFISANRELKPEACFRLARAAIKCIKNMLAFSDVVNGIWNDSAFEFMLPLFAQANKIYPD